ncbi:uncharacterized protein NPIL_251171 [Nephila pilipes]|uniref:Uncharacterized protein n=1 Tax=Nephila pilipes TaxID=299642 RepID=A0A8X6N3C3_NEPPI|nr:uncharacterized protein NPIL_251171 [Nephila pilipes]
MEQLNSPIMEETEEEMSSCSWKDGKSHPNVRAKERKVYTKKAWNKKGLLRKRHHTPLYRENDDLEPKRNRYSVTHPSETEDLKAHESGAEGTEKRIQMFIKLLTVKDRDAARFMWSNGNIEGERDMITYRFKLVLFGVNSTTFLLSITIKNYIEQFHSEQPTATSLLDICLYVNELIADEDSVQNALEVSRSTKQIVQKVRMTLRKWITNESKLMYRWKQEGFDTQQQHNSISYISNITKVSGIAWNTAEDCLTVEIQS